MSTELKTPEEIEADKKKTDLLIVGIVILTVGYVGLAIWHFTQK